MSENSNLTAALDQDTARASLVNAANALATARADMDNAAAALKEGVLSARTEGKLTVPRIAEAAGRQRNFVDALWSGDGRTVRGKQTRVRTDDVNPLEEAAAFRHLNRLADAFSNASAGVSLARASRNRLVTMVYASGILGPSVIAETVGMNRNTVLRIARAAGVAPVYRVNNRNQHTVQK